MLHRRVIATSLGLLALALTPAGCSGSGEPNVEPDVVLTKIDEVDNLGNEAWLLWARGNGSQVTYHWRRGNLVGEAHVHCFGSCPTTVDEATRTWAEAIDEEAQAGS